METKVIGDKIAGARKKVNISQAQLAQRLFISPQAVGKWERGESIPDIITFSRLAEILGVDLNYFSENFRSLVNQDPGEVLPEQPSETPLANQKKQLKRDMSNASWVDADFSGLNNLQEKFSSSNMQRCVFTGSDLSGLLLKGNNVDRCDFSDSNISGSRIERSHLVKNIFRNCSLKEAEFAGSHVQSCDFSLADFTGATIRASSFEKNIIADVVWSGTSFNGSSFADMVFEGMLEDCSFENCGFSRMTFRNATLLNTFFKNNSGIKRVKFIDCKADKLTYAFLKNEKADLSGVEMTED